MIPARRTREHYATRIETLAFGSRGVLFGDDAGVVGHWRFEDDGLDEFELEGFSSALSAVFERTAEDWLVAGGEGLAFVRPDGALRLAVKDVGPVFAAALVDETRVLVATSDEQISLVDAEAGRTLDQVSGGERVSGLAQDPKRPGVFAVAVSNQGGSRIRWLQVETDTLRSFEAPDLRWSGDHLSAPAFDASGTRLGCAEHRFEVFDVESGHKQASVDARGRSSRGFVPGTDGPLVERYWSAAAPFGQGLACATPNGDLVWLDRSRGAQPRSLGPVEGGVTTVGGDGAGQRLVAAGRDGKLHLFEP